MPMTNLRLKPARLAAKQADMRKRWGDPKYRLIHGSHNVAASDAENAPASLRPHPGNKSFGLSLNGVRKTV